MTTTGVLAAFFGVIALAGCGQSSSESTAGVGGACPMGPHALFNVTIKAESGPVPPDTTIHVSWSIGPQPPFVLDDPTTWKAASDAGIVCDVSGTEAPSDLPKLSCQLWATGPTEIRVSAKGYAEYDTVSSPAVSDRCNEAIPTNVAIVLHHPVDGGT